MKNLSIFALTKSFYKKASPFISFTQISHIPSINLDHVIFSKSFSTFMYSQGCLSNLDVINSRFSTFLNNAVKFESNEAFKLFTVQYKEKIYTDMNFSKCLFENCSTEDSGSAIYLSDYHYKFELHTCGFRLCLAKNEGGAIYFEGVQFVSWRCCFLGCVALDGDQAFVSRLQALAKIVLGKNSIIDNEIYQCSPAASKGGHRCSYISGGNQCVQNNNFTRNHVLAESGAMALARPLNCIFTGCSIANSSATSILWMHELQEHFKIEFCILIGNDIIQSDSSLIALENCDCTLKHWSFVRNKARLIFDGSNSAILFNCTFDTSADQKIFGNIKMATQKCRYNLEKPGFALSFQPTYECYAYGIPSPSPSKAFDHKIDQDLKELDLHVVVLVFVCSFLCMSAIGFAFWKFFLNPFGAYLTPEHTK